MSLFGLHVDELMRYDTKQSLFRPSFNYPEYPFKRDLLSRNGSVYSGLRSLFKMMSFDGSSYGLSSWNPLGGYIKPGDVVLIKPNLVCDRNLQGDDVDCLYTNPSVLAPVVDYAWIALRGDGEIVVADAPVQNCNYEKLLDESGLSDLISWYQSIGVNIVLKDLRGLKARSDKFGLKQTAMPREGVVIDLGQDSEFYGLSAERLDSLRITNYDPSELRLHHNAKTHEYCIAKELLNSNVVINLPKPKTHRKAGLTGALKNMVGINVRKEYLPHHSMGPKSGGFDEYEKADALRQASSRFLDIANSQINRGGFRRLVPNLFSKAFGRLAKLAGGDDYSEGSWYGNDTIWRTVLDLNKIVFFADKNGSLCEQRQRAMIVISDMVIIGEGEGPLTPEPNRFGMLAFSDNPVEHDIAMARLMGSDATNIPTISNANRHVRFGIGSVNEDLICISNDPRFNNKPINRLNKEGYFFARPSKGWESHYSAI